MSSVRMTEAQLSARLRADAKGAPKAVYQAMFSAAQRGKAFLVERSPVDRGILRNAWKIVRLSSTKEVELTNDQPYAGVVERGARPFKISKAGREALTGWVKRKILAGNIQIVKHGASTRHMPWKKARAAQLEHKKRGKAWKQAALWALEDEAKSIAFAIAKKFERVGMKGKRFVMKNLPALAGLMDAEVTRYLSKFFNRPFTGGK
jgi:hypothetical protein